ncbi:hypothetical protein NWFMUON74_06650 [Nocardia wallacei]|uniref:Uncharacterized protein n=1 Tax=Nocardia wallacei TaxID=480035 RepID=A0A7G1KF45_9NOCA|nr:hypothetical protein NWFMUON74_06650 [Nocardia wallacei]
MATSLKAGPGPERGWVTARRDARPIPIRPPVLPWRRPQYGYGMPMTERGRQTPGTAPLPAPDRTGTRAHHPGHAAMADLIRVGSEGRG